MLFRSYYSCFYIPTPINTAEKVQFKVKGTFVTTTYTANQIGQEGGYVETGDIVDVTGGTTAAKIEIKQVTALGEVINCKLLVHGLGYSTGSAVATSNGTGTGFTIDIKKVNQDGGVWLFPSIYPNVCDDPYTPIIGSNLGSSVYIFRNLYAHNHYFDTTHYTVYDAVNAFFDFLPGGSIHTYGDLYADNNVVADYDNAGTGGFIVGTTPGIS